MIMSDKYLKSLLGDNEEVLFVTHQHWLVLAGEILSESLLTVGLIVAITLVYALLVLNPLVLLGYLLLIFPIISLVRDVLIWSGRKYVVTNRRVMQLSGVFNKNVTDSSLEKVNDVKLSQSFMGRMLDYGDIEILTASELGVNKFTHIGHPIQYKGAMINAKERLERVPGQMPPAPPAPNPTDLLSQLDALRQHGVLTEAEFQSKKADLLKKL
jgi:hypothetical protein